jgi:hypothetical protein
MINVCYSLQKDWEGCSVYFSLYSSHAPWQYLPGCGIFRLHQSQLDVTRLPGVREHCYCSIHVPYHFCESSKVLQQRLSMILSVLFPRFVWCLAADNSCSAMRDTKMFPKTSWIEVKERSLQAYLQRI